MQNIKDRELREKVETSVTEEPEVSAEEEPVQIPVDFATLQAENPDIYAWIRIADTPIDYPILQKEGDDDYYLYRTVDGEEGLPGSIMTEYSYNPHAFSEDPVTVVYGHNMLNDSFFSRLKDFQDETFRKRA
ncbi:MAG: class B sortase [Eubacterium ramulus]